MATLKGNWYFKERLTEPSFDLEQYNVRIETTVEIADPTGKTASFSQSTSVIFWSANGLCGIGRKPYFQNNGNNKWSLYFTEGEEITLWSKENGTWVYSEFRNIQFEQPVEVTEDFYNWFTQNAVNLQPEGTWRFNKTLTDPGTFVYSHDRGYAIIGTAHDTETGSSQITHIGYDPSVYLAVYDIEADGYNIWDHGSWYSEEARLITFIDKNPIPLNPEFALWFYENAFPMDLTFCSECYIAEIADTIRQIKGTTQKYAIKNLADEITTLYECANEEVY